MAQCLSTPGLAIVAADHNNSHSQLMQLTIVMSNNWTRFQHWWLKKYHIAAVRRVIPQCFVLISTVYLTVTCVTLSKCLRLAASPWCEFAVHDLPERGVSIT